MLKRRALVIVALVVLAALTSVAAVAQDALGSESNPIRVYFVPSVEADTITTGGEVMAAALKEATGLNFEVFVPTSYAATIEEMCASPSNSMGFIPSAGYIIANNRCGVDVAMKAVRNGFSEYWSAFIVRRDSGIRTFGDLNGKTWAYGSATSASGYLYPAVDLANAGIVVGDVVEAGGHPQTVTAVFEGDADFGTVFFSPVSVPTAPWQAGDDPEPYDLNIEESYLGDDGNLYVGDVRINDARALVRATIPSIVDEVKILRLTSPIPNDTLSFGPDFPADVRQQIVDALLVFAETEEWNSSIGHPDSYAWSGIVPAQDSDFDIVRGLFDVLGLTEEDMLG